MKAHGLALAHRAFVGFWPCGLLCWGLFFNVSFFGPGPHGPGSNPVGWAKLTPLVTTEADYSKPWFRNEFLRPC